MRSKRFPGLLFLATVLSSLCSIPSAVGQEKLNLSVGLGHPELLNAGVRLQMEQSQFGLSLGALPGSDADYFAVGADYYYHFGGFSELSERKPWFGKAGLNYKTVKDEWEDNNYLYLVTRLGRDFNLSRKFGIAVEAGITYAINKNEKEIKPRESSGFFDGSGSPSDLLPSLGVNLFYRL